MHLPPLSLVTVYRQRRPHLQTQRTWWEQQRPHLPTCEWIVIEADAAPTPGLAEAIAQVQGRYAFLPNSGTLHKTKALNLGLSLATGDYLTPLDVDLIPLGTTLTHHLQLATLSPQVLMTGYRLMATTATLTVETLAEPEGEGWAAVLAAATIAPEDQPSALRKHLLQGEKFGVLPFFRCDRLRAIGGWDEAFVGWGAEDQDVIERYLGSTGYLCRSPQLVYLHLHHDADPHWREASIVAANRQTYYGKRGTITRRHQEFLS